MALCAYLVAVVVLLASALLYFVRRQLSYWRERGIPHNQPSLLFGNLQGILRTRSFADIFKSTYEKFKGTGPFCGFYFFQRPAVVLLDSNLIKNVLIKDFSNFADRGVFHNEQHDPLSAHLFALDGPKWRSLRNQLSPTFTSGRMKFMFPTVVKVAEQFVDTLAEMVAQHNDVVEIKELLARYTTDVIGTCAFGIDCNSLKDPNAEFRVMGRRAMTDRRHGFIVNMLIDGHPKLAQKLGLINTHPDIHDFFMRIVRESIDYREKHKIVRNDFLDLLIELKNGGKRGSDVALKGLSMDVLAAQAFVFFLAGFETSSTTMGFAMYELAQHQEIQSRVRLELETTLAKYNNELSYDCMKELKYLNQVVSETLRKYPIVPHLVREGLTDYTVPGYPDYVIGKGMPVIIPVIGIQHDPCKYPEPEKFDPERFDPENVQARDSVDWLPFGDGPRNCIGLRFGLMQARIGIAFLLKNFKFSVCKETEIPLIFNPAALVINSQNGIFLKVERVL